MNTILDICLKIIALLALFYYLFRHIQLLTLNKKIEDKDKQNRKNAEERISPYNKMLTGENYLQASHDYKKETDAFWELKDKNEKEHLEGKRDNISKSIPALKQ